MSNTSTCTAQHNITAWLSNMIYGCDGRVSLVILSYFSDHQSEIILIIIVSKLVSLSMFSFTVLIRSISTYHTDADSDKTMRLRFEHLHQSFMASLFTHSITGRIWSKWFPVNYTQLCFVLIPGWHCGETIEVYSPEDLQVWGWYGHSWQCVTINNERC